MSQKSHNSLVLDTGPRQRR